jgi:hypothetical protein
MPGMKRRDRPLVLAFALLLGWLGTASAASVITLAEQADVVVVARIQVMTGDATGAVTFTLEPVHVLKGQVSAGPLPARLEPSSLMRQHAASYAGRHDTSRAGQTALWFLRDGPDGIYQILPTRGMKYIESHAYIPVPPGWASRGMSFHRELLSAVVAGYRAVAVPTFDDDGRLVDTLTRVGQQEGFAVIREATGDEDLSDLHIAGWVAAIRMGADEALILLPVELERLRQHKKFGQIVDAFHYYEPRGLSSIAHLWRLAELHPDIPGLHAVLAKVLGRIALQSPGPMRPVRHEQEGSRQEPFCR